MNLRSLQVERAFWSLAHTIAALVPLDGVLCEHEEAPLRLREHVAVDRLLDEVPNPQADGHSTQHRAHRRAAAERRSSLHATTTLQA
eukprot:926051-Prymnesium_polylepis.1